MKDTRGIILILDSILDDYYFLWECFEEYKQNVNSTGNSKEEFSRLLKVAYKNKYLDFYIGEKFNGEEKLIPKYNLTNFALERLLDFQVYSEKEIRVTTSKLGISFLEKNRNL